MDKIKLLKLKLITFVLSALSAPACLQAGAFSVSPMLVELDAKTPFATIEVTNDEAQEMMLMQASAKRWTKDGDKDTYAETQDLIVIPPMFRLNPGQKQTIRIALPSTASLQNNSEEMAYRIYIEQLAAENKEYQSGSQTQELDFFMNVGVPLFVLPSAGVNREAYWEVTQLPDNKVRVDFENTGNVHIKINAVDLFMGDKELVKENTHAYIFSGGKKSWELTPKPATSLKGKSVTLKTIVNGQEQSLEMKVN